MPNVASAPQTIAWMVQKFPIKRLQQLLRPTWAVWDFIVTLKGHTARLKQHLKDSRFHDYKEV
jgi:hypothetical protein